MNLKEIFYCNLIVEHKGRKYTLEKVVHKKSDDGLYHNRRILKKYGIPDPPKIIKMEPIKSLGFENSNIGFHTGTKNEEKRNNITGAYE